jgi:hypothetical protein
LRAERFAPSFSRRWEAYCLPSFELSDDLGEDGKPAEKYGMANEKLSPKLKCDNFCARLISALMRLRSIAAKSSALSIKMLVVLGISHPSLGALADTIADGTNEI